MKKCKISTRIWQRCEHVPGRKGCKRSGRGDSDAATWKGKTRKLCGAVQWTLLGSSDVGAVLCILERQEQQVLSNTRSKSSPGSTGVQVFKSRREGSLGRRLGMGENMLGTMGKMASPPCAAGTKNVECERCCGRFTEGNSSGFQNARRNAVKRRKANDIRFLQMEAATREDGENMKKEEK